MDYVHGAKSSMLTRMAQGENLVNIRFEQRRVTGYATDMDHREEVSQIVADNLVRLIAERETTASALGIACGFSQSAVHDIIKGRSQNPKISTVAKLAKVLNVPISELFLTRDQIEAQGEMLRAYHLLPEAEQRRLAQVARAWHLD
jgi:transcriptional regulator with XRE-family HTH domain